MPLIEGIGDEVTHFFIILFIILIASLAWWTTNITEQRHVQTVWLLDRRRQRAHRRLTNHTHTVSVGEGTPPSSSSTPAEPIVAPVVEETVVIKPPEPSTSSREEDERAQIVEAMDAADTCEVRQRRLAFYNRSNDNAETPEPSEDTGSIETEDPSQSGGGTSSEITVKLKYINDDLKIVDGKLHEPVGDFKKRHFQEEISTNKLVRLIFKGQVLHPDSKTLESCGLFDNCVVHCLVHQKKSSPGEEPTNNSTESTSTNHDRNQTGINNNNNNNQGRDWDLGNFFFAIITFTLLSAWYFRYVYAHLYTVTATVGLILMTGIFTIVLFGFYFPDHDHGNRREDNTNTNSPPAQS